MTRSTVLPRGVEDAAVLPEDAVVLGADRLALLDGRAGALDQGRLLRRRGRGRLGDRDRRLLGRAVLELHRRQPGRSGRLGAVDGRQGRVDVGDVGHDDDRVGALDAELLVARRPETLLGRDREGDAAALRGADEALGEAGDDVGAAQAVALGGAAVGVAVVDELAARTVVDLR